MKSSGCKILAALCLLTVIQTISAVAQDTVARERYRKGLIFEGKAENPKVFSEIEGGKATMLVPAYEWEYGLRVYTKETWKALGAEWNAYVATATAVADQIVDTLKPDWVRDDRGVIDYAVLKSDDPFLSSVLISKKFHALFKEKLGENLHIVIPERSTIYLFPAEGGKLNGYGPGIVERFKRSKQPVSTEVIHLNSEGYKVIGELGK